MDRREIELLRGAVTAQMDQIDAATRARLRRTPKPVLDRIARELGVAHPEYSLHVDLVERIIARIEEQAQ